jgi:Flp pilus assembly protein TadG
MGFDMEIRKRSQNHELGQNLLEFALVLPMLMIVMFGVLDLGRVFFATISLTNAAREGVRYLTIHPDDVANDSAAFWGSKVAAIDEANYSGISLGAGQVTVICSNADGDDYCDSGSPATVTVTYNFDLVLGWFLPTPITLTRSAVMLVP